MRLQQKSFKIQYIFKKKISIVERHDATDFWIQKFFQLGPIFDLFLNLMDQKSARAKKVANEKNWFLHARQLREGIMNI